MVNKGRSVHIVTYKYPKPGLEPLHLYSGASFPILWFIVVGQLRAPTQGVDIS